MIRNVLALNYQQLITSNIKSQAFQSFRERTLQTTLPTYYHMEGISSPGIQKLTTGSVFRYVDSSSQ